MNAYLDQKSELAGEKARLGDLERERDRLSGLISDLDEPAVLEARARELGLVRPGEIPFVVSGLQPERRREQPADTGAEPADRG